MTHSLLVYMGLLMSIGGLLWGTLCIIYGLYIPAIVPFFYVAITVFNFTYLYFSKNFNYSRNIQILISLLLPFFFQFFLGGFISSGGNILWSVLAVFGSFTLQKKHMTIVWLFLFILLMITSGFVDSEARQFEIGLSEEYTIFFFVINFILVISIIFSLYYYFVTNEEKARHKLEVSLEQLQQTQNQLIEAEKIAKIGSWKFNYHNETLDWSNETYNIFGIDKIKHLISSLDDFFKLLHHDDIATVQQAYAKHLETQEPYAITHKIITSNDVVKYVEERCETIFDEDGTPLVSNGTVQDITEQKLHQMELMQKDKQLLSQSRLAQMGEMISMIAHQWRQPLGAISSTSIDLNMKIEFETFDLEQDKGREECQSYFTNALNDIDKFVQSLTNTIDDFRNFYKPNKKSENIKLEEVCMKSLAIIKTSLINNNINVIENYCCNEKLEIHTNEMIQVVLNILKNAQDNFLEKDIKEPYIKISTNNKVLSICDNGGGIPDAIIDKIFDPYFSTKDEKNGTGLGLYMSKIIIEEHHNGKLTVVNTDDGVCFKIELGIISEEQKLK